MTVAVAASPAAPLASPIPAALAGRNTAPAPELAPGHVALGHVSVAFGSGPSLVDAVQNVSLQVGSGALVSLVGPSGSGKSTLLNVVAGLVAPAQGRAELDGLAISGPTAARGVAFQPPALFPWLTVIGNLEHGLRAAGVDSQRCWSVAREALRRAGLLELLHAYPYALGDELRQRVLLVRAFAQRPRVLLLDDPFAPLDVALQPGLERFVLELWRHFPTSVLFASQVAGELVRASQRVYVLGARPGRVLAEFDPAQTPAAPRGID